MNREALEQSMDKYRLASARMASARARGRLVSAEFWRQMREGAVEEMWNILHADRAITGGGE